MERVQRWREPAVVVVVLVLLVRLGLALASAGSSDAASLAPSQLGEPTPVVVLALLVLACHARPVTDHARTLAALGVSVAGAGLLIGLGLVVWESPARSATSALELADRLTGAAVAGVAVLLLGLLAVRPPSRTSGPALESGPGAEPATLSTPDAEQPAHDPALEPTWAPDVASGAAWTTAGEAATGRPASAWGTPAGTGWEVARPADGGPGGDPVDPAPRPRGEEEGHPWGRPSP